MARKKIPEDIQEALLVRCQRVCCLCHWLNRSLTPDLQGQIAHVNHNHEDNRLENLAYLCLRHHDTYDSTPRQTKKLKAQELIECRERLYEALKHPTPL